MFHVEHYRKARLGWPLIVPRGTMVIHDSERKELGTTVAHGCWSPAFTLAAWRDNLDAVISFEAHKQHPGVPAGLRGRMADPGGFRSFHQNSNSPS